MRPVVLIALALTLLASGSIAEAKGRRAPGPRRPNLPLGWTWPPSRDTRQSGARCLRDLRELGVAFKRVPRRRMIATPVVVPSMAFGPITLTPIFRKPPFAMDCRLARALATHGAMLAAFGIRELRFSSIYDYRRVRMHHRVHRALSRHSLGLAVDVYEVVLESGARLIVRKDYWSSPALMVTEMALRASGDFRAILSPAVDPDSHADHLHMEVKVEQPAVARNKARRGLPIRRQSRRPD